MINEIDPGEALDCREKDGEFQEDILATRAGCKRREHGALWLRTHPRGFFLYYDR